MAELAGGADAAYIPEEKYGIQVRVIIMLLALEGP